jgi:hypothetical protein
MPVVSAADSKQGFCLNIVDAIMDANKTDQHHQMDAETANCVLEIFRFGLDFRFGLISMFGIGSNCSGTFIRHILRYSYIREVLPPSLREMFKNSGIALISCDLANEDFRNGGTVVGFPTCSDA